MLSHYLAGDEMQDKRNFTSGPILGPLLLFSLPILLALFLQALYGAVDLLVEIGRAHV